MSFISFTETPLGATLPLANPLIKRYEPGTAAVEVHHPRLPNGSAWFVVSNIVMRSSKHWARLLNNHRFADNRMAAGLRTTQTLLPTVSLDALDGFEPWDAVASMEIVMAAKSDDLAYFGVVGAVRPETLAHVAFYARALGLEHDDRLRKWVAIWSEAAMSGKGFRRNIKFPADQFGVGPDKAFDSLDARHYVCYLYVATIFGKKDLFTKTATAMIKHVVPGCGADQRMSLPQLPAGMNEIVEPVIASINEFRADAIGVLFSNIILAITALWQYTTAGDILQAELKNGNIHPNAEPQTLAISLSAIITGLERCHKDLLSKGKASAVYGYDKPIYFPKLTERILKGLNVPVMPVFRNTAEYEADAKRASDDSMAWRLQQQLQADQKKYRTLTEAEARKAKPSTNNTTMWTTNTTPWVPGVHAAPATTPARTTPAPPARVTFADPVATPARPSAVSPWAGAVARPSSLRDLGLALAPREQAVPRSMQPGLQPQPPLNVIHVNGPAAIDLHLHIYPSGSGAAQGWRRHPW